MMRLVVGALVISVVAVGSAARTGATDDPVAEMAAACPCDARADGAAWVSHGEYVACVASEARQLRTDGMLRPRQMRAALWAARLSTCGNPDLTRCCVYQSDNDDVGRCRMMSPDACDALDSQMENGGADDMDSGSCLPNPCAF
jgi:hypothetical protein